MEDGKQWIMKRSSFQKKKSGVGTRDVIGV